MSANFGTFCVKASSELVLHTTFRKSYINTQTEYLKFRAGHDQFRAFTTPLHQARSGVIDVAQFGVYRAS